MQGGVVITQETRAVYADLTASAQLAENGADLATIKLVHLSILSQPGLIALADEY